MLRPLEKLQSRHLSDSTVALLVAVRHLLLAPPRLLPFAFVLLLFLLLVEQNGKQVKLRRLATTGRLILPSGPWHLLLLLVFVLLLVLVFLLLAPLSVPLFLFRRVRDGGGALCVRDGKSQSTLTQICSELQNQLHPLLLHFFFTTSLQYLTS